MTEAAGTVRPQRWLELLRLVTISALLVSSFGIEILVHPGETLRPLFYLAGAAYGMVLLYALADRWLTGWAGFLFIQLVGDALLVTGFVRITGGLDSPMSFLYLLPIGVGSMLLFRRGGIAMAGLCWALYAALAALDLGLLGGTAAPRPAHEPGRVGYFLVVHLVSFVATALLASYLSERLRSQTRELQERRGAIARLQALNENIIESINSGLITTDPDGRINFINRGGIEITGLDAEAVTGRSVESLLGESDGFLREIRRKLLASRRHRFERNFETADGRRIFLGFAVSNLHDRSGHPLGYIFIFQDLTEIQALEQEVRLKERMAALGEMAAGMAHELRNPLASICGAVQYLRGEVAPKGEALELMDIILRESQRLDRTIRDFLTFARPGTFAPERCDLVRLFEDNLKLLRKSREFREGCHRIETRWGSAEVWCEADPNQMRQVFWNLATNALKAMPDGGALRIFLTSSWDGSHAEIVVEDEGIGMDETELKSYFQPFHSLFDQGTGLGAAIVYRIVEEHGGRVSVDSAPRKGTRVRITLPGARQAIPEMAAAGVEVRQAGGALR